MSGVLRVTDCFLLTPKDSILTGPDRVEVLLVSGHSTSRAVKADFEATGLICVLMDVTSAEAALAALRGIAPYEQPIDPALILVDLASRDDEAQLAVDLEFLAELKGDRRLRSIPVVILTEDAAEADILNAYSRGACSFVSKPNTAEERRRLIRRFAQYWAQVVQLPKVRCQSEELAAPLFVADDDSFSGEPVEILVVDDSEDDVLLLKEAFSEHPLVSFVQMAEDGEQALQYLRRQGPHAHSKRPSLVLLDINMPKKNGFEVLSEIRADANLRDIPVVMLTTSKQESDILRAYDIGACSFIAKPVEFGKMRQIAHHFAQYWTAVADVPRRVTS